MTLRRLPQSVKWEITGENDWAYVGMTTANKVAVYPKDIKLNVYVSEAFEDSREALDSYHLLLATKSVEELENKYLNV